MLTNFTILTTKKGTQIKIRLNQRQRKYTIIENYKKYKSLPLSIQCLNNSYHFTPQHWENFIKSTSCYLVKKLKRPKLSKKAKLLKKSNNIKLTKV